MQTADRTSELQAGSRDASISLHVTAVFQLLLFGLTEKVRDEAARVLEPLADSAVSRCECSGGPFAAKPRWQQASARLIATMMSRSSHRPLGRGVLEGCLAGLARTRFGWSREDCVTFTHTGGQVVRQKQGFPCVEELVCERFTFGLENSPSRASIHRAGRSWTKQYNDFTPLAAKWNLDAGDIGLVACVPYRLFRGLDGWQRVRVRAPDGRVVSEFSPPGGNRCPLGGWSLDPGMILRIESGALAGHVMERWFEARRPRAGRTARCLVAAEIGTSFADPPHAVLYRDGRCGTTAIERLGGSAPTMFPLLGNDTLESLDAIACAMGVVTGHSIRGSFAYHPLRAEAQIEAA